MDNSPIYTKITKSLIRALNHIAVSVVYLLTMTFCFI